MKRALLFALSLILLGLTTAHAELPAEVRADLLKDEIIGNVRSGDYAAAKNHIAEYRKLGLDMPAALLVLEAKVAAKTEDWIRAKTVLEDYFNQYGKNDSGYAGALDLYKTVLAPAQKIIDLQQQKVEDTKADELYREGSRAQQQQSRVKLWLEAAEMGHAVAMRELGLMYLYRIQNGEKKGLDWTRKSASLDNRDALVTLADLNMSVRVIPRNVGEGIRLYKKSAALGSGEAHLRLGAYFTHPYNDKGVYDNKTHHPEALTWYLKVAENHDNFEAYHVRRAQLKIGEFYLYGPNQHTEQGKMLEWLTLAANEKNVTGEAPASGNLEVSFSVKGRLLLALIYANPSFYNAQKHVEQDLSRTIRLLESIKSHDADAALELGKIYYKGTGTEKNDVKAEKLFRRAAGAYCPRSECWTNTQAEKFLQEMGVEL